MRQLICSHHLSRFRYRSKCYVLFLLYFLLFAALLTAGTPLTHENRSPIHYSVNARLFVAHNAQVHEVMYLCDIETKQRRLKEEP